MRTKYVLVVLIGLTVSVFAGIDLRRHILEVVTGREIYHSWIPFIIGLAIALPIGIRLVNRIASPIRRVVLRCIVFTMFLAPVPFG